MDMSYTKKASKDGIRSRRRGCEEHCRNVHQVTIAYQGRDCAEEGCGNFAWLERAWDR